MRYESNDLVHLESGFYNSDIRSAVVECAAYLCSLLSLRTTNS